MYGREPSYPTDNVLNIKSGAEEKEIVLPDYAIHLAEWMESAREIAVARTEKMGLRRAERFDFSRQNKDFEASDLVLVYNPHKKIKTTNK